MLITKTFSFESAHRLSDYLGKCERIHGHNYKGKVTIRGVELQSNGILIDFSEVKRAVKSEIIDKVDHRLLLKRGDDMNEMLGKLLDPDWIVWMDNNPTAENMAEQFRETLQLAFGGNYDVFVELFETDDSSAIAEPPNTMF